MKLRFALFSILFSIIILPIFAQSTYYFPAENYGGKDALKDLLRAEMVYPDEARANNEEGTVKISFTVSAKGETENIQITESVSPSIDREALRLFNLLLWDPAQSKGTTTPEDLEIEIPFKYKKYQKTAKHRGYDKPVYMVKNTDKSNTVFQPQQLDSVPRPVYTHEVKDFTDFMIQNLKYPDAAKRQGISGTVDLFFVVEPTGNVSNYKVEQGVGAGCNEEALRLLKLLHWFPGMKDGKAVRTAMKISITFNLEDSENMRYVPANNANQI
jgi:TonB family protein